MPRVLDRGNRRDVERVAEQLARQLGGGRLHEVDVEQDVVLDEPVVQRQAVDELDVSEARPVHAAPPSHLTGTGPASQAGGSASAE